MNASFLSAMSRPLHRQRVAAWSCAVATACAAALVFLPKGFAAFGALLLVSTLMAPVALVPAWKQRRSAMVVLAVLVGLVLLLTISSMHWTGQGWNTIDNPARFLLLPWSALAAFAFSPPRTWLWAGAMVGIVIGFCLALMQMAAGMERAGGGANPIVFANTMLALMVLALLCRPEGRRWNMLLPVVVVTSLGAAATLMSGSRGVLPGLALLVLFACAGSGSRKLWTRLGLTSVVLLALVVVAFTTLPGMAQQSRLGDIRADLENYALGNVDSPIGARLEFLTLAGRAFVEHPWTGVGIDRFGTLVAELPACDSVELHLCSLGHAHNDIAQWSATMGIPGLLVLLGLYLVPLLLFVSAIRSRATRVRPGAAWAGVMLVLTTFLSGMTQSVFSHALTTTMYAVLTGLLLGLAWTESAGKTDTRRRSEPVGPAGELASTRSG